MWPAAAAPRISQVLIKGNICVQLYSNKFNDLNIYWALAALKIGKINKKYD